MAPELGLDIASSSVSASHIHGSMVCSMRDDNETGDHLSNQLMTRWLSWPMLA